MTAFNWIKIKEKCPNCGQITVIKCQTHIASSYEGDVNGRFHDKEYGLGEPMRWWPKNNEKFKEWRVNGKKNSKADSPAIDYECCYSTCNLCKAEIYVIIQFEEVVPKKILETGLLSNWSDEYYR